VTNQRKRKTTIHCLESPAWVVESTEDIMEVAAKYYKELFRYEHRTNLNVYMNFFSNEDRVSEEENIKLEGKFA
jgi:hypothetical protein